MEHLILIFIFLVYFSWNASYTILSEAYAINLHSMFDSLS